MPETSPASAGHVYSQTPAAVERRARRKRAAETKKNRDAGLVDITLTKIEIFPVADWLVSAGHLPQDHADDLAHIADALRRAIIDIAARAEIAEHECPPGHFGL